ncbi:MAG: sensor histidine kinase [Parasporobacterium sp.]|nr:sensor histidine kinase [Parasporobacterium sp.]
MLNWLNGPYFLTVLGEWIACVIYITRPPKRFGKLTSAAISLAMLLVQTFGMWITTKAMPFASMETLPQLLLRTCLYIALMILHIYLNCNMRLITAVMTGLYAFLVSELAWGIEMFLQYVFIQGGHIPAGTGRWLLIVVVFAVIFTIVFFAERAFYDLVRRYEASVKDLIITLIITLLAYALSNAQQVFMVQNLFEVWDRSLGLIPRWVYVLVALFILYGRRIWKGYLQVRHELEMISNVFDKQKGQYEQASRNAEIINQKYHDLKNQIAIIKSDIPVEQQKDWLDSLEEKVAQIEPERLTGNPVLDTILWEKNQYCLLNGIHLSYVMDGELFANIAIDDLCVIFGGALDNAIEAVMKIPDPDRRLIHVKAMRQQGYLAICVENISETPLEYKDGELVTTKDDKQHHGYGFKGIRYTAEKYGGTVSLMSDEPWVRLTVLLKA